MNGSICRFAAAHKNAVNYLVAQTVGQNFIYSSAIETTRQSRRPKDLATWCTSEQRAGTVYSLVGPCYEFVANGAISGTCQFAKEH
jgi:hypothetical protein